MGPRSIKRMGGFSIVELMVVVGIVALLAAFAAPNMGAMIRTQRVRSTAFDIFSSLTLARSEAIKRNTNVTMSPNGSWTAGWTVTDANGNELRRQGSVDAIAVAGPPLVTYNGSGRLTGGVVPFQLTADVSGSQQGALFRCVSIDLSGRPVSKAEAC